MKGIILAGGTGSRLLPLTLVTNKHLLPVYNKPMIFYPLMKLKAAGIKEVLIISGREHCGHILSILGSGKEWGMNFSYEIQETAGGIAHALALAENFAKGDNIAVILGDNIFEDNFNLSNFKEGAKIFLKEVPDAQRFGVAEVGEGKILSIEEKPSHPKSNLAITGFYVYDSAVFDIIKTLKPSARGELEITEVNGIYMSKGRLEYEILNGYWSDAGTFPSLLRANMFVASDEAAAGDDFLNSIISESYSRFVSKLIENNSSMSKENREILAKVKRGEDIYSWKAEKGGNNTA